MSQAYVVVRLFASRTDVWFPVASYANVVTRADASVTVVRRLPSSYAYARHPVQRVVGVVHRGGRGVFRHRLR